jgi:transcriptional regulator of arginine metabolism
METTTLTKKPRKKKVLVKRKRDRLQLITDLIKTNCIGSQSELADMLREHNINVTQATLSRDLKALKISKVATDRNTYMYIIPDSNQLQDRLLSMRQTDAHAAKQVGLVSVTFSGNLAVIKTRNGYAPGLAYDIDMSRPPEVLGTIAGADTVVAILAEGVTHEQAKAVFEQFMPKNSPLTIGSSQTFTVE